MANTYNQKQQQQQQQVAVIDNQNHHHRHHHLPLLTMRMVAACATNSRAARSTPTINIFPKARCRACLCLAAGLLKQCGRLGCKCTPITKQARAGWLAGWHLTFALPASPQDGREQPRFTTRQRHSATMTGETNRAEANLNSASASDRFDRRERLRAGRESRLLRRAWRPNGKLEI